jgi:purine-binding chemotaxis protein CheW
MNTTGVQLACFKVGAETYGVDIMQVKEIIRCQKITPIPKAPDFIEGIINLRGEALPVIDMRKRFDLGQAESSDRARIIIACIADKDVGLVVDSVTKVLNMDKGGMQPAPEIAKGVESEYLKGVTKDGEELVMIVDMKKILSTTERVRLENSIVQDGEV